MAYIAYWSGIEDAVEPGADDPYISGYVPAPVRPESIVGDK